MKEEEPGSDLMVEVLGTLANLNCDALDITETCQEHGLLEYAAILLSPGEVDDDVALEAVMFVGSIVCEFNAQHVVDCGLVERMYTLMSDKKEDDEFVLQIAHAFGAMLRCEATRERCCAALRLSITSWTYSRTPTSRCGSARTRRWMRWTTRKIGRLRFAG